MTNPQTEARALPELPDDDSDFTPDLARKIIKMYQTALAAKDAELVKANMLACANAQDAADESERAACAEAQLAEANKALEEIADAKTELTDRHDYSRGWNDALFRVRQIARRARAIASGGKQ